MDAVTTGQVIAGKYRIERQLGEGGMGAVFVAENIVIQKKVALKVMHPELCLGPHDVERFMREGVAASRVHHPSIIEVYDAGQDQGLPWIAMELLDGENLQDRLDRDGALSIAESLEIVFNVLAALVEVHGRGIIHRDIKPANIFLARSHADGIVQPKLLDFGIAKHANRTRLTDSGAILGTAQFMAPEQVVDSATVDARCDLYSIGGVLFVCLSGELPFDGSSLLQLFTEQQLGRPRDLMALAPSLTPELAKIVHWCLARDPDARPQSSGELIQVLRGFIDGQGQAPDGNEAISSGDDETEQIGESGGAGEPPTYPSQLFEPARAAPSPMGGPASWSSTGGSQQSSSMPGPSPDPTAGLGRTLVVAAGIFLLILVLFGVVVVGIGALALWGLGSLGAEGGPFVSGFVGALQWNSGKRPMIADINGDEVMDIVGWVQQLRGSELRSHIAAFDGETGERLWWTDELSNTSGVLESRAAILGPRLLVVDETARLRAFNLSDGELAWQVTLSDRVSTICQGGVLETAVFNTSNGQNQVVHTGRGEVYSSTVTSSCVRRIDAHIETGLFDFSMGGDVTPMDSSTANIPGMRVEQVWATRDLPVPVALCFGVRSAGTEVPMVAAIQAGRIIWSHDVPAHEPLRAETGEPRAAAVGEGQAVVVYELMDDTKRVSAFDIQRGTRSWDVELPNGRHDVRAIDIAAGRVFVTHWTWLDIFDAVTGERSLRIGRWR